MKAPRRTGRRPGDPEVTRRAILTAARERFADVGYDRATIRAIAADAGVDPALVHHHYGTKRSLFAAAHEFPTDPSVLVAAVAEVPIAERGEQIARIYLTVLASSTAVISLIRGAATDEAAARMMRGFVHDVLIRNADRLTDQPDARQRLALIGAHMIGVVFARVVVGLPELRDADVEDLVTALAPTIQRYLTAPDLFGAG